MSHPSCELSRVPYFPNSDKLTLLALSKPINSSMGEPGSILMNASGSPGSPCSIPWSKMLLESGVSPSSFVLALFSGPFRNNWYLCSNRRRGANSMKLSLKCLIISFSAFGKVAQPSSSKCFLAHRARLFMSLSPPFSLEGGVKFNMFL